MVVHVYHPYRQPDATNFCLPLNGRCSHICVPAPQLTSNSAKTSCLCPHGLKLDKDSLNCVTDGELLNFYPLLQCSTLVVIQMNLSLIIQLLNVFFFGFSALVNL